MAHFEQCGVELPAQHPHTKDDVDNFKELTISGTKAKVSGLVLLPDNSVTALNSITNTNDLATYNAVFLPAAGGRGGTKVEYVGSGGYYWLSTSDVDVNGAWRTGFLSGGMSTDVNSRNNGNSVRLVRSAN